MTRLTGIDRARRRAGLSLLAAACGVTWCLPAPPAHAQAVIQALPNPAQGRLSEALRQLSRDPNSINALIDAGQASLALDDPQSALGFFRRAETVNPADGRVKAGLASVMVRQGQALEAIRLFAEAEQAGEAMLIHASDRGLAYDLIGDNTRAQKEYSDSLRFTPDPIVIRRLAISQAIAGDQRATEATLLPQLQANDLSAFRARAFALAILGKTEEAVTISDTLLPQRLSSRMAPYLRYMPRLTRAQQAAAANLGTFPPAAEIGRDDPAVTAYAAQLGVPQSRSSVPGSADARLVPAGEPLGRTQRTNRIPRRDEVAERNQPSAAGQQAALQQATTAPAGAPQVQTGELPPVSQPVPIAAQPAPALAEALPPPPPAAAMPDVPRSDVEFVQGAVEQPLPQEAIAAPDPSPAPVVVQVLPDSGVPEPSISIAGQIGPPADPAPPATQSLVDVFSDLSNPTGPAIVANGAVDMSQFTPRRDPPPPPPAPPKPVEPSRQWVQVATGRDTAALGFDWRRMKRTAGGLLDKNEAYVATWGQTNRLVTGPFPSASEADQFVKSLKEKNIDSFRFTSAEGEEVRPLD